MIAAVSLADWRPTQPQAKLIAAVLHGAPVVGMCGGWGAGKTRLIVYLCELLAATRPRENGFIVLDSMGRLGSTVGKEFEVLERQGWAFKAHHGGAPAPHWRAPNGVIVWLKSWKRPSTRALSANSLEGIDCGWGIADECNQYPDSEIATAMLGRVRSGSPGRVILLGKPSASNWWVRFAQQRGGVGFFVHTSTNAANLPGLEGLIQTMTPDEVAHHLECAPLIPSDAVYGVWSQQSYPAGNIIDDWRPEPWMRCWVSIDFGVRKPAAMVFSFDTRLGDGGAWVMWSEAAPDRASVFDVCAMLRRGDTKWNIPGVWPRRRSDAPDWPTMPLDAVCGDRAGRNARDDRGMTSAADDLQEIPRERGGDSSGGLGLPLIYTDDPERVLVAAGISATARAICTNGPTGGDGNRQHVRRLLCTRELWNRGLDGGGDAGSKLIEGAGGDAPRCFATSIVNYRYRGQTGIPVKDGRHDHHADLVRYFVMNSDLWPTPAGLRGARAAHRVASRRTIANRAPVDDDR